MAVVSTNGIVNSERVRLVELYGALKRAPSGIMRAYWTGRIEEFAAQNAISDNELELARREARKA